jgi:tetratricopeptide (TPR) repeat protein
MDLVIGGIMKRTRLLCWTLSLVATFALGTQSVDAATKAERIEQWGSQNIAVRANQAAQALKDKKYSAAISHFRALIGLDRNNEDFYLGLYVASDKSENYGQAVMALEELFDRKPELKATYAREFVDALKKAERESSEIKAAEKLVKKDAPTGLAEKKVEELTEKSLYEEVYVEPKKLEPVKRKELDASQVHIEKSRLALTYETAFAQCENIVVAEFNSYDKGKPITYYTPPKANYRIVEYLKGAPFNKALPIKYEFHEKIVGEEKPKDWKFDEAKMMPQKGSKWILFIPNAVPLDGMLETFHGSYGRQAYNEENNDKILKIIQEHRGATKF